MQRMLHFLLLKNCKNGYSLTLKSRTAKVFPRLSSGGFWKDRFENWAEFQTYLRKDIRPSGKSDFRGSTSAWFPTFQHSGFYFPPSASKDRAVNSMEIKDFIMLWTYSQWRQAIVVIPPLSPERETFCMLPLISFRMLALCKKRTFRFTSAICKDCAILSREWHNHSCGLMVCLKAE